jgi:ribosomal protein S27E
MKKCKDCGNTRVFREPQIEWQQVYYDERGEIEDTENVCYEDSDLPIECDDCDSTNIDLNFQKPKSKRPSKKA